MGVGTWRVGTWETDGPRRNKEENLIGYPKTHPDQSGREGNRNSNKQ